MGENEIKELSELVHILYFILEGIIIAVSKRGQFFSSSQSLLTRPHISVRGRSVGRSVRPSIRPSVMLSPAVAYEIESRSLSLVQARSKIPFAHLTIDLTAETLKDATLNDRPVFFLSSFPLASRRGSQFLCINAYIISMSFVPLRTITNKISPCNYG